MPGAIGLYVYQRLAQIDLVDGDLILENRRQIDAKRQLLCRHQGIILKRCAAFKREIVQGKRKAWEPFKKRQPGLRKGQLAVNAAISPLFYFITYRLREKVRQRKQ